MSFGKLPSESAENARSGDDQGRSGAIVNQCPQDKFLLSRLHDSTPSNGELQEAVQEFTCLGSKTQLDGNITSEKKTRIAKAANSFKMLSDLWNQRSVPSHLKIKVYYACVRIVIRIVIRLPKLANKTI